MSYIIKHNNSYTTLTSFLLNESIIPVETKYRTNETRDNQNFLKTLEDEGFKYSRIVDGKYKFDKYFK